MLETRHYTHFKTRFSAVLHIFFVSSERQRLSRVRWRKVYLLIAAYLRFLAVFGGCRIAENRGLNRISENRPTVIGRVSGNIGGPRILQWRGSDGGGLARGVTSGVQGQNPGRRP